MCNAVNSTTVCASGTVRRFLDDTLIDASVAAEVKVRIYDPNQFMESTDPTPLFTVRVDDTGCFIANGVPRTGLGLLALTVDDSDTSATDTFARTGALIPIPSGDNVTGIRLDYIETTNVQTWETQAGTLSAANCSSLSTCGAWIGRYRDNAGNYVGNATPVRPSDPASPNEIFCFRRDRLHLQSDDTTDEDTGTCLLSPDIYGPHTGTCAGGTACVCLGDTACTPTWSNPLGGTLPFGFVIQDFFGQ